MYQQYDKAVRIILNYLCQQGFSKTPRKCFHQASREFKKHLDRYHFKYSHDLAQAWICKLKLTHPKWKFLSFRRSLALIDDVIRHGTVTNLQFTYNNRAMKCFVPEFFRPFLDAYLQERKQDGNQSSALQMDSTACTRFLLFLKSQGIAKMELITSQIVKKYYEQAEHRTSEGKNAYIRRIRGFIRFLARKKIVPVTLELAFTTEKASRVSIVTTLTKEQISVINDYSKTSSSPSELRNAAMIVLSLRMGFRSSDICNLCLTDISWESRTISIIQQKTSIPLKLPFPVEVGNILTKYILNARPQCNIPNVFITLKHPYTKLNSSRCYVSTLAILGRKKSVEDIRGLHIARRTFASNLLAVGNPVTIISAVLGHTDEGTVDEYLATNDQRMRQCAIGLAGIEIREVLI